VFDAPANEYAQMAHEQYSEMISTYREVVITALDSLEESETESTT
jgi:hypothetical protein